MCRGKERRSLASTSGINLVFSLKKNLYHLNVAFTVMSTIRPQIQIIHKQTKRIIIQLLPVIHKKHTRDDYKYIMICLFPAHHETKCNSFPRNKTVG